jgi:hypothetical protein
MIAKKIIRPNARPLATAKANVTSHIATMQTVLLCKWIANAAYSAIKMNSDVPHVAIKCAQKMAKISAKLA